MSHQPSPVAADMKKQIGGRLRQARSIVCDSASQCARSLGIPPNTWLNYEAGERYPDPYHVVRFCDTYGLTTDFIYRGRLRGVAPEVMVRLAAEYPELVDRDPDMAIPAKAAVPVS